MQTATLMPVCVNFCRTERIPAPKDETEAIPVVVKTPPREKQWEPVNGPCNVYDIVFNTAVLSRCETDSRFKAELVELAFDCIAQQKEHSAVCSRTYTQHAPFSPDDLKSAAEPAMPSSFEDLNKLLKEMPQDGTIPSPLDLLRNVGASDKSASQHTTDPVSRLFDLTPPKDQTPPKHEQESESSSEAAPVYSVSQNVVERTVTVTVELPLLDSASEVDLDVSSPTTLTLHAPGLYRATITLPRAVDPDSCTAKFVRKTHVLRVTLAMAS